MLLITYTPLHRACDNGSIFGVKSLVEHKADINSVNKVGITSFMLACRSHINPLAKVRYLCEKGANCQAKDYEGKTALFYATWPSKCEDEVKDVLRYLVIEKGIDINSVDKEGRTPLLEACDTFDFSFLVIRQLIELGADVSVRNKNKQNALHIFAKYSLSVGASVIDLLIKKGVDVTCQDEDGKTPYEVARNGERRALLRQHYDAARFSVLQREIVRPGSIKLCIIGSEMAGKTTLVNSLLKLHLPPIDPKDRTAGVEIRTLYIPKVGKGTTWDFGAQWTFHKAHGLFFQQSNTLFCLVLPIRGKIGAKEVHLLLQKGRYWCAFAKASLRTLSSTSLTNLVIIFNFIGLSRKTGSEVSLELKYVAETLEGEFGDTFKFSHAIELDCSKSESARMKNCREKLNKIREEMLTAADDVPKLCHAIEKHLSLPDEKRKRPLPYFLTHEEFEKWVAQDIRIVLNEDEKKVAVGYLDSVGIIINLGHRICVQPPWLCHNVIGPLLAPPEFLFGMPTSHKAGKVSRDEMELALKTFENHLQLKDTPSPFVVTVDEGIQVLLDLDLCIPVRDMPGVYQIPALLNNSIPDDAWVEDLTFDVYRGQRYECDKSIDIISPSSFAVFQSRCSRLPNTSHAAWKDGVKLVRIVEDKIIECLIESDIKKEHCCIDIILRWSSEKSASPKVAKEFLDEVKTMIVDACDERSPGAILNWFYLDSSHLRRHDEDPAIYSCSEVDQKLDGNALNHVLFSTRPEKRNRSLVRELVIVEESVFEPMITSADPVAVTCDSDSFPSDDELVPDDVMRACAAVKGSKWEDISVFLGISLDTLQEIRDSTPSVVLRMFKVLKSWSEKANSPTVGKLLKWFEEVGVNRRLIKMKFEEHYGRH
ncbi:death-associated protein kinase 1-like isoform X2 [Oscarella lobularis]|uniref:death-associated protein kinase 1-like isoform X2 n=1 Tax=Oscarella lobularis TaxID=121494 RepID=UPI00331333B7